MPPFRFGVTIEGKCALVDGQEQRRRGSQVPESLVTHFVQELRRHVLVAPPGILGGGADRHPVDIQQSPRIDPIAEDRDAQMGEEQAGEVATD